ncbi:MAG: hypothetical protein JST95_10860 [Bacteroidetes bacterium]|nr:hypothetical protein [Bacteroidota bacterium]
MFKFLFLACSILLFTACKSPKQEIPGSTKDSASNPPAQTPYIDKTEALMRMVNFDTAFAEPYFKSLNFNHAYWISSACFNAMVEKLNSSGMNGVKLYFAATPPSPYSTSLQWIATDANGNSDFGFKFDLDPSLNPGSFGIDIDKTEAQTQRETFAEKYRQQAPTNLNPGAKGTLDNVSAACWFDYGSLKEISDQLKGDASISGIHLYVAAYYDGKDDGRSNREYDVQTTLLFVATQTDATGNKLVDAWDFFKENHSLVLNHGILCPSRCN